MKKIGAVMGKCCMFLVKGVYLLPFLLLGVWLLHLVYLPDVALSKYIESAKPPAEQDVFKAILTQSKIAPRGHFHMIDEFVTRSEPNASLCLHCHGNYPHSKEKKVRSILNFHHGFIACAVCHARKRPDDAAVGFAWVDRTTGRIEQRVAGSYGKYPAKIFPVTIGENGSMRVIRPVDENAARQFLKYKNIYNSDQIAQAKIKLHTNIDPKPVFCSDCHKEEGYLDFASLGFSPQRVNHLNSTEVVGLIEKYKTFYMPAKIDFGSGNDLKK